MGWFKKLTGISSKSVVQAGAAAAGAYVGGPQGAALGYNLGGALTGDQNALNNLVNGALTGNQNALNNLVNGAVGLGSDYLQSQINLKNQKELAKYDAEQQWILNQQAFDQNVNMWNMQNAYNTPVQQMQRLAQAGLSPNLIYGSGNVTGNTAGKAPEFQAPTFDTGAYHPVDTRIERAQLALAMESQYQQVQNQKIQNDLARQKLALAERASDRADVSLMLRNNRKLLTGKKEPVKTEDENPFKTATMRDANTVVEKIFEKAFTGGFKYLDWLTSGIRERKDKERQERFNRAYAKMRH